MTTNPRAPSLKTDYSDLHVDLAAKSDTHSLHIVDNGPMDSDGFGSGTTHISDRLVAHRQDDNNEYNNDVVDDTQLQFTADQPPLATVPLHTKPAAYRWIPR